MSGIPKSRRNFLKTAVQGTVVASASPVFVSGVLASCAPVHATARQDNDDLKALQAAIANRQQPLKWVFTGDSITQGAKHTLGYRSYPEIVSEHVRFEMNRPRDFILNTAVSGHTTSEILQDFEWRVGQFSPKVVSLMIGTNDAAKVWHMSPEAYGQNLENLVQKIRALTAIPILQTPNIILMGEDPSKNERADLPLFVEMMRKVAAKYQVILVDHWAYWTANTDKMLAEKWLNDPLHPNGKGHLQIARLLFRQLGISDDHSFTCVGDVHF